MEKNMAGTIQSRRKELGMTQLELAEKMGVTDKAVSKWERGLSCPDVASLPRLAAVLEVSVEELMAGRKTEVRPQGTVDLVLKAVALAMGVAVVVTNVLGKLDLHSAVNLLGLGLAALAVLALRRN